MNWLASGWVVGVNRSKKCIHSGVQLSAMWSDMGTTHLLIVCQAPDEPVKNIVGQWPQREVSDDGLHHLRV